MNFFKWGNPVIESQTIFLLKRLHSFCYYCLFIKSGELMFLTKMVGTMNIIDNKIIRKPPRFYGNVNYFHISLSFFRKTLNLLSFYKNCVTFQKHLVLKYWCIPCSTLIRGDYSCKPKGLHCNKVLAVDIMGVGYCLVHYFPQNTIPRVWVFVALE